MKDKGDWDLQPKPGKAEQELRKVRRSALRNGAVVGIVLVVAIVWLAQDTGLVAEAEGRCGQAMRAHLEQADAFEDPATAAVHAQLAQVYQLEDARGHKCRWWSP